MTLQYIPNATMTTTGAPYYSNMPAPWSGVTAMGTTTNDWLNPNWLGGTTAPPTPYWLPAFSPGQVANQPMQKLPVKVPGGQLWSRTPWSQRMGLGSYINWAAGTPGVIAAYEDYIDAILGMMPRRAPTRAGRWAPMRTY